MKKDVLKSIGAVLAGLTFIGITHSVTDKILESAGVLPKGNLYTGVGIILFVIAYRAGFSLIGCYITAVLSPKEPLKHSLILGGIGALLSTVGAIATADLNVAPAWYGWSLVAISLPIGWIAGKLYIWRRKSLLVVKG